MTDILSTLERNLITPPRYTGYLHCSTHLSEPLIHTIMDMNKFPRKEKTLGDFTRVFTGTLWHEKIEEWVSLKEYEVEVDVTDGLPDGWTGTADLIHEGKRLIDIKTVNNMYRDHPDKYIWQVSAYYHALMDMGYFLTGADILYIPLTGGAPVLRPLYPLPRGTVHARMQEIKAAVDNWTPNDPLPEHPGYEGKVRFLKTRSRHELDLTVPKWCNWCDFVGCPCQQMVAEGDQKCVAYLGTDGGYHGDKKYEKFFNIQEW